MATSIPLLPQLPAPSRHSQLELDANVTSIGIGVTSLCNLACPHCYSRHLQPKSLSLDDIVLATSKFPRLRRVNFGTGESILNKSFLAICDYLKNRRIAIGLTSNGLSVCEMTDDQLTQFNDIDISLDFPVAEIHDEWRAKSGTFAKAAEALERCASLDLNLSIALCLMNHNYKYIPEFKKLVDRFSCFLRINLYKPVHGQGFLMSYTEFWQAMDLLATNFALVSNSEPILSLVIPDSIGSTPCGNSVRLNPDMTISGCVYLHGATTSVSFAQPELDSLFHL